MKLLLQLVIGATIFVSGKTGSCWAFGVARALPCERPASRELETHQELIFSLLECVESPVLVCFKYRMHDIRQLVGIDCTIPGSGVSRHLKLHRTSIFRAEHEQ